MAGSSAERQETAVVKAVDSAVRKNRNQPITVVAGSTRLSKVYNAKKYQGRQQSGSEPYTDVVFMSKSSGNINLSLKGESAPSLAGGGLKGLEVIIPGLAQRFMRAAHKELLKQGLKKGDKVPDIYGRLNARDKKKVVIGTAAMGGPIDYMYIGGMNPSYTFNEKTATLTFNNGSLVESADYANTHDLFFRLRARRIDQTFDPDAIRHGAPRIYSKSPSKGDSAGRIVVTNSVPRNALVVKF